MAQIISFDIPTKEYGDGYSHVIWKHRLDQIYILHRLYEGECIKNYDE